MHTPSESLRGIDLKSRRLHVTFRGDLSHNDFRLAIFDYGYRANRLGLNCVLFDLTEVPVFDPELSDIYIYVHGLCPSLPSGLLYVFFVRPGQMTKRLLWDLAFSSNGYRVKSTSEMREVTEWLTLA